MLDGNALAKKILTRLQAQITQQDLKPCLAIVSVGYHEPSYFYFRKIEEEATRIGIRIEKRMLLNEATEQQVVDTITQLNNNPAITSILLQFPLPPHIQEKEIVASISPRKDVDGFHPVNREALLAGTPRRVPPAIAAIAYILESLKIDLAGKSTVVLVHSIIFGELLKAQLRLLRLTPELMVINLPAEMSAKKNLQQLKAADIVVSALGFPGIIQESWLKQGVILLDLGFSRKGGVMMGDMRLPATSKVPSYYTPVPGGVGPVTAALLLKNVVEATKKTL